MSSPVATKLTLRNIVRRFRRNRRGSAAIEFALVAPVFFALLFAIIETAIMSNAIALSPAAKRAQKGVERTPACLGCR